MKARTLGARRLVDINPRPVDLLRLHGDLRVPANRDTGISKQIKPKMPLRLLIKASSDVSQRALSRALRDVWAPPGALRRQGIVASRVKVRPLVRRLRDGSQWYVVELAVPLGAFLHDVDYSPTEMRELLDDVAGLEGVLAVEYDLPSENMARPLQEVIPGCTAGRDAAPDDVDWAPRLVRLLDLPADGPTGAGVRIGHLDSGFTDHPELDLDDAYDLASSTSTIDSAGGLDPMPGGTSHGTATASVITSRHGTTLVNDLGAPSPGVTGLAPDATIVAARTLDSVVVVEAPVFVPSAIAEAVLHCINEDSHVFSMSFGGFMSLAVKDALVEAYEANVILCAAAGNCVGFVIEPASMAQVIGCGGVGLDPATGAARPWTGTSEGPGVDISAPAENVWIADWINNVALVKPGEGTSFAAPHIAGAAALWLEHHGRASLLQRYEDTDVRLTDVYREVLRRSANVPPGWNTQLNGAGVLDVVALLDEALPDAEELQPLPEINVLPIVGEPVEAVIDIDHLTVRDDGEALGGAKPYVLLTFFQIDGDTARIEAAVDVSTVTAGGTPTLEVKLVPANGRDSFVSMTRRGRHGNVDEVNIGPIELHFDGPKTVNIDSDVGAYRRTITPIPIRLILDGADVTAGADIIGLPGFVGVHAILAKQNLTPDDAVVAAHRVVRDGIRSILEDVLETVDISDLSVDPSAFVERTAEIEDAAKAAAAAEMDWWETFWGGVIDPDDQLIQVFAVANVLQLSSPMPIERRYQGDYGDWILVGEIRLA